MAASGTQPGPLFSCKKGKRKPRLSFLKLTQASTFELKFTPENAPCGIGVPLSAESGQRLCLWNPRFFEKNRVKLFASRGNRVKKFNCYHANRGRSTFYLLLFTVFHHHFCAADTVHRRGNNAPRIACPFSAGIKSPQGHRLAAFVPQNPHWGRTSRLSSG